MNAFTSLLMLLILLVSLAPQGAHGQATSFTYQGQLRQSGEPFIGMADLEFRLYDQLSGGTQIGSAQSLNDVPVEDGLFQVELDFGAAAFDGSDRFLEVSVDGAPLIPRQKVTATPYALLATGLASGSVGGGSVDPTEVQLRVVGTCPPGEYVRRINQDGSVLCSVDIDSGGTVTEVVTGAGLTGGPITDSGTVAIAPGGVGTTEIDTTQVQRRVNGICPPATYLQTVFENGTVGCSADAIGNDWRRGGNAGTDPSVDFLGTTDAMSFEIRTNSARSFRVEPSTDLFNGLPITANVIAGSAANEVTAGVRGATIAGGGVPAGNSDPLYTSEAPNRVLSNYGAVGGGFANVAGRDGPIVAPFSTVSGGLRNEALEQGSTVAGGLLNVATGLTSTIGGGGFNGAEGASSTVSGGIANVAGGELSAIGGGDNNESPGALSTIGGGRRNLATGQFSATGGGLFNESLADYSTVVGGLRNVAPGSHSTVSGGSDNCAGGAYSWVGGSRAKVRPDDNFVGEPGGCFGVALSGDSDGDNGTFVWADSQQSDFVSSGPDQFLIRALGGVGVGTNTPQAQLHVTESVNANAGNSSAHVAIIENTSASTGGGPDVLALKTSMAVPDSAANFITFFDGSDDPIGRIEGNGAGGIVFASGGADFAEWLPKRDPEESIEPGDVVGWHADGISLDTRGAIRVMAVSTRPIIAGNAPPEDDQDQWARVGFIGQVPVRVRGSVEAGDWIVASGAGDGAGIAVPPSSIEPDHVRRIIGQALETAIADQEHRIDVAVGLGDGLATSRGLVHLSDQNRALRSEVFRLRARLAELESRQAGDLLALQEQLAALHERLDSPAHLRSAAITPKPTQSGGSR